MRTYPEYKDSGVEWIGEIPRGWKINRLKYFSDVSLCSVDRHILEDEKTVKVCHYPDVYNNEVIKKDTILPEGTCSEVEFEKFRLKPGDVLITKDSESPDDIGVPTFIEDEIYNTVCGYHICQITPDSEEVFQKFLFRFIESDRVGSYFETESNGITRFGLGKPSIENLCVPIPPLTEQKQISDYLDRKSQQIDNLIEKTERKIELLKEQRSSLINQCVTKGLDPNVEMKDSGVEWIGEIPKGWEVTKLKFHGDVIIGLSFDTNNLVDESEGILVLRSSNVQGGKISFSDNIYVDCEIPEKLRVRDGDILICSRSGSRNLIGKNCLLSEKEKGLTWGVFMTVFRSPQYRFFYWLLNSQVFKSQSGLFLTSTINQLTVSTLENLIVSYVPDEKEQRQISDYLNRETSKIDRMVDTETKHIELLKEYHQSLISNVVTGKIDVRDEVVQ